MLFTLSVILVFLLSFVVLSGMYILLVANKFIKKRRVEKLFRFILVYSVFITLVYIFQYMFI